MIGTLIIPTVATAQQWTQYTVADGLPPGRIFDICEDREGNLWFAGWKRACRFDGFRFRTFTEEDGLALRMTVKDMYTL